MNVRRAAIAQMCSTSDKLSNLWNVAKCAGWAKRCDACMLFLPECFGFIGENADQTLEGSEYIPDCASDSGALGERKCHYGYYSNGRLNILTSALTEVVRSYASSSDNDTTVDSNARSTARALLEELRLKMEISSQKEGNDLRGGFASTTTPSSLSRWPVLLTGLRAIARESGLWISAGGMHEAGAPPLKDSRPLGASDSSRKDKESHEESNERLESPFQNRERVYNTHLILDSEGEIVCKYRKIHLFDVSIPSSNVNLRESNTTAAGNTLCSCDTPLGRIGLLTCYDLRFPEQFLSLCEKHDAQLLLVPSAFTIPTGRAHWHVLLRARAIENQCYVLAAAQYGKHNRKRSSYGHTLAVDPWGKVLADAGGSDGMGVGTILDDCGSRTISSLELTKQKKEERAPPVDATPPTSTSIVICDIDLDDLESIRERMPVQSHRKQACFDC